MNSRASAQECFVPDFYKYKKRRWFLSGHAHAYEHLGINRKDFLIVGGSGGLQQQPGTGEEQSSTELTPQKAGLRLTGRFWGGTRINRVTMSGGQGRSWLAILSIHQPTKGIIMKSRQHAAIAFLVLAISTLWLASAWSQQQPPRLMVYNAAKLAAAKQAFLERSEAMSASVKSLLRDADKALGQAPVTITSKKQVPPSGDKRDYMSLAPYWWPDPNTKDGLPYIRKDGQVNPERFEFKDRELWVTLQTSVTTLAAAYYISNKDEYAAHAARMLRVWFLDSATHMNPNMNFSEAVKGRNAGRGAGIIGISLLPTILDAVVLIRGTKHWSDADDAGIQIWCKSYLTWLRTSPNGIDEQDSPNNHGTWYDVQLTALCLFTGMPDTAKRILEQAKSFRIASQIQPDGRMPLELERTRGLGYSSYNLLAMSILATIASGIGVDLWHYETPDGRSIRKAIEWMVPYYEGTKQWEYQQISEWDPGEAVAMLTIAGTALGSSYTELAGKISKNESALLRARLMY